MLFRCFPYSDVRYSDPHCFLFQFIRENLISEDEEDDDVKVAKPKKKKSMVWKFFAKIDTTTAKCRYSNLPSTGYVSPVFKWFKITLSVFASFSSSPVIIL